MKSAGNMVGKNLNWTFKQEIKQINKVLENKGQCGYFSKIISFDIWEFLKKIIKK